MSKFRSFKALCFMVGYLTKANLHPVLDWLAGRPTGTNSRIRPPGRSLISKRIVSYFVMLFLCVLAFVIALGVVALPRRGVP